MNGEAAAENLNVIRTLMERSALYRRALGPIMLWAGALGLGGAFGGVMFGINSLAGFSTWWAAVAAIGLVVAVLIARRQALMEREAFWSPPAKRVVGAILPGVILGGIIGAGWTAIDKSFPASWQHALLWTAFYGCALHAAGYFTTTGLRKFSWAFTLPAALFLALERHMTAEFPGVSPHWVMGVWFGALQFAYGVYLLATEKRSATT